MEFIKLTYLKYKISFKDISVFSHTDCLLLLPWKKRKERISHWLLCYWCHVNHVVSTHGFLSEQNKVSALSELRVGWTEDRLTRGTAVKVAVQWTWRKSGRKESDFYEQEKKAWRSLPVFYMKNFKHITKLKEFHSSYSRSHHLDSTIYIWLYLSVHLSVHLSTRLMSLGTMYFWKTRRWSHDHAFGRVLPVPRKPVHGTCMAPVRLGIGNPWLHSQEGKSH